MPQQPLNFNDVLAATAASDPKRVAQKRKWLTFDSVFISFCCSFSIGFLIFAYCVSLIDPEYFNRRVLATMRQTEVDTMRTGTVAPSEAVVGEAMPAPRIVRLREPRASDYQIITVFDREAILATPSELIRIKIGSIAPGLGEIRSIDETETGIVIGAAEATLRSEPD